jgi:hypothetical protein
MANASRSKLLRIFFWALLIYTALSSTLVLAFQFGLIAVSKQTDARQANPANPSSAKLSEAAFVERFVKEYFLWNKGKEESRADRLKPYLAENLDVQGGVDTQAAEYNSFPQSVNVWEVKERNDGSGIKDVVVWADVILTNVNNPQDQKRAEYFLMVSIVQAGSSYRVVDRPHFIPPIVAAPVDRPKKPSVEGESAESAVKEQIERFLLSFWKVYTTGEPQEIAYYYKGNQPTAGLRNLFALEEMEVNEVYKEKNEYVAQCQVIMKDLISGILVKDVYQFRLVQEDHRWYVINMKQGEV